MFRIFRRTLCFLVCVILSASLRAGTLEEIQHLLASGDAAEAYRLAGEEAAERAGDPEFDFWYGLAALEAGHADQAIFALERVLLARPDHHRARLELGRAYFRQGDLSAARTAFGQVLAIEPPVNVRRRVGSFLAAIDRAEQAAALRVSGHVALRAGFDSNINSATTDPTLNIPALGQLVLDDASLETDDEFMETAAGMDLLYPLSKLSGVFFNASLRERNNLSSSAYDLGVVSMQGGLLLGRGPDRVRLPVSFQKLLLDDNGYRNLTSVGAEWSHQRDPLNQWTLFAQAGAFRYDDQTSLDTNLKLAGGAWSRRWEAASVLGAVNVYVGDERARDPQYSHNGKSYHGVRLGVEWQRWERHRPYLSLTLQQSEYDADHPAFGVLREDDFAEIRLGWLWRVRDDWSVRTEVSHIRNDSSISLYEYDRDQFFVGVRYGF